MNPESRLLFWQKQLDRAPPSRMRASSSLYVEPQITTSSDQSTSSLIIKHDVLEDMVDTCLRATDPAYASAKLLEETRSLKLMHKTAPVVASESLFAFAGDEKQDFPHHYAALRMWADPRLALKPRTPPPMPISKQAISHSSDKLENVAAKIIGWLEYYVTIYTRRGIILLKSLENLAAKNVMPCLQTLPMEHPALIYFLRQCTPAFEIHFSNQLTVVAMHPDRFARIKSGLVESGQSIFHYQRLWDAMFRENSTVVSAEAIESETLLKVAIHAWHVLILRNVVDENSSIKSVELANDVRQRVGTEGLQSVKNHYGGFLTFLEQFDKIFHVHRIPKEDSVHLVPGAPTDRIFTTLFAELRESCNGQFERHGVSAPTSPNRSLHVGNVPLHYTEECFAKEFAPYGPSKINLVTQKGRRYGFIQFETVKQAQEAKAELSKTAKWKSNISFAKRDTAPSQTRQASSIVYTH